MAHFNYIAKDSNGRTVKGREFAMSERELVLRLARKYLTVISVKRVEEANFLPGFRGSIRRMSVFDQMVFCRQLATLLKGGVSLVRGLDIIAGETENATNRAAVTEIGHYIKQGESFSAAIKRMGRLFSPIFTAAIEAGERTGALDVMLERLTKYLAAQDRLDKKIVSAIAYPSAVLAFFFFAIGVMTFFLIPRFKSMYASFNAQLPPFTLAVFGVSDFLIRYIAFIIGGVTLAVFYVKNSVLSKPRGRYAFNSLIFRIPLFGNVMKKAALSKFSRTLATLLGQGIPVPESMELVGKSSGSAVIETACAGIARNILDGDKIHEAFRKAEIFPSLVIQMTTIGAESGNLPELLDKTADFYEEEVDTFLGIMSSLIEPILIIVLGLILSVFIIALYLPIFKLSSAMGQGIR